MSNSSQEAAPKKLERVVAEKTGALSPQDSVETAGERMRSADANAWPVADDGKLVGVIDQADPDRQAAGRGHDPKSTKVGDSMRRPIFCYEDQDASEAKRMMDEHQLNHLPVVDRSMRVVGIISQDDVAGAPPAGPEPEPVEDWVPGEGTAEAGASQDQKDEPSAKESVEDAERFPFRPVAESSEAR
jgi:CBS domain-containing protein